MPVRYRSELAVRADPTSRPGPSPIPVLDLNLSLFSAPPVPLWPRRHDSTWQGPPWESVPCVVGHGRIIRPRVRTSVGPGRPSERRGRVAGRELAARPAVDPAGGRPVRAGPRGVTDVEIVLDRESARLPPDPRCERSCSE